MGINLEDVTVIQLEKIGRKICMYLKNGDDLIKHIYIRPRTAVGLLWLFATERRNQLDDWGSVVVRKSGEMIFRDGSGQQLATVGSIDWGSFVWEVRDIFARLV